MFKSDKQKLDLKFSILAALVLCLAFFSSKATRATFMPMQVPQNQQNRLSPEKQKQKAEFDSQFPIADYSDPEPANSRERIKRQSKNNRVPKGRLDEPSVPNVIETVVVDGGGPERLPAIPVGISDAVVIGNVVGAQAYLSSEKTGLYSEFSIQIEVVLKDDSHAPVLPGEVITIEREGGRIRYLSGRIRLFRFAHEGMPRIGSRYIFFLRHINNGEMADILTGYELRADRIFPLDGVNDFKDGNKLQQFADYEGSDEATFLKSVRDAIAQLPTE